MVEKTDVQSILDLSVKKLDELEFDDYIINTERSNRSQLRFSDNQITIAKNWASMNISVYAIKESKTVATFFEDISNETITNTLESLHKLANALPPNQNYYGISDGPFSYPNIEFLLDPEFLDFHDQSIDKVESAIRAAENEGAKRSAGVLVWDVSENQILSSRGAKAKTNSTAFDFNIRSFVDEKSSGYGSTVGRLSSKLDFEGAGKDAGRIAKMSIGGINGEQGKYNVIFAPKVGANIVGATPEAANPFSVEIGQSWLKDKIGEKIGSDFVSVYDDALLPNGLGSRIFDEEGHPTGRSIIIEKGILKGFIHNTSTAKKAGTTSTGNAGLVAPENTNIFFEPGEHSFEELLEITKDKPTLYITNTWYTRFTSFPDGIFSSIPRDGMFLVEKGEISQPVRELRISDTMPNIFKNIIAMGKDNKQIKKWEPPSYPIFIPHILIEDINITAATS